MPRRHFISPIVVICGAFALSACATAQTRSDAQLQEAVKTFEKAAAEAEAKMSPEERAAMHSEVERSAIAEMQAKAKACGTKLHFTNEPRFQDRSVFVDASATADQLACVHRSYPFVKAQSR